MVIGETLNIALTADFVLSARNIKYFFSPHLPAALSDASKM